MMDYYAYIDDFVHDRLDPKLKADFIEELNRNSDLAEAVKNHDIATDALDLLIEKDIRAEIDKIKVESPTTNKKTNWKLIWVALLGLGLLIMWLIMRGASSPSNEEIYASHFKPFIQPGDRGSDQSIDQLRLCDQGHYYMTQSDFAKAIELLNQSINQNEECQDKSLWLQGLYFIKNNNIERAKSSLSQIVELRSGPYYQLAEVLMDELD